MTGGPLYGLQLLRGDVEEELWEGVAQGFLAHLVQVVSLVEDQYSSSQLQAHPGPDALVEDVGVRNDDDAAAFGDLPRQIVGADVAASPRPHEHLLSHHGG